MQNLTSKQIYGILSDVCTNVIEPNLMTYGSDINSVKKGFTTPYFKETFDSFNDSWNGTSIVSVANLNVFSSASLASLRDFNVKIIICVESNRFLLWTIYGQKISIALDSIWIMTDIYRKTNDQNNTTKHTPKTVLVNGQILSKVSFNLEADKAKLQKHLDSGKIRFIPNGVKATNQDKANIMAHANLLVFCQSYLRSEALRVSWKFFYKGEDLVGSIKKGKIESQRIKECRLAAKEESRIIDLIPSLQSYNQMSKFKIFDRKNEIINLLKEYRETKVINFSGIEYLSYLEPLIYELALVA